jgi:hypothetical protein
VIRSHTEAKVYVDGKFSGHPPFNGQVVCGRVQVLITHPRYAEFKRRVATKKGAPTVLEARLQRPEVVVRLTSKPAGATLSVNGRIVGKAPTRAKVKLHSNFMVTASLDGYKTWAKSYRLTRPKTIRARLKPIPGAR